ncbi:DUF2486 family protein [Pararobbsia alpina]|uniref:DUF2486 domain-containing protein n=1 Tax=Pararobbsia alpina TaxID=621374 RepID=A0A6S7AUV3_9BURK|nr:DUF2486 family protein [Pararobbsia alpina]CAB3776328.1 hypothetical protein LMG28138_00128 [Pararobbsia alpina]
MRDDDLSIPVLADILEPGDPAKADPAVPRRPMDHAWTDALAREVHGEPLAAIPMLNDVLVPGDSARAQHSPPPADSGLTIPLLTEVLSDHNPVTGLSYDETRGAPIPMLTDVIADFDEAVVEDEAQAGARAEAQATNLSAKPFAFELDDVPPLPDVSVDEAAPVERHAPPEWHEARTEPPVSTHSPIDLSALASSIEANLLDSELPFRAYGEFPGEPAPTPIDVGDSALPPSWPMDKVPLPFGSGEPEVPVQESPETEAFAHDPTPLRAVIAPESSDADTVSAYPVPFEPIATEPLPEAAQAEVTQAEVAEPEAVQPEAVDPEVAQPEALQPEALQAEVVQPEAEFSAPAMSAEDADHLAAMLSQPEPVAAELNQPQPEYLSPLAIVPAQTEIDHVAADVRARALRYLASEGHALIESRCQEQAVWLAHRITREIAATLEREIGQWVQDALNEALQKRLPPR